MKRKMSWETIIILIIVAVSIPLLIWYGFIDSVRALLRIKLFYVAISFIVFLSFTTLRVLPWSVALRKLHIKMGWIHKVLMTYYFWGISSFLSVFGQAFSLREMERFKKNARFFSGSILLSTSLVGTLALSIIMLVSAIIISKYIDYAVIFVLVFYVLSSLLGFNFTFKWLINYLKHRNGNVSKGLLNYIQTLSKFRGIFSQRYILLMLLAFLPALLLEGSLIYFILVAENQSISFIAVMFIFSFSDLVGLITLSPSGIGSMDAVLILLLLAEGVPGAVTISTDLLFRLFQFFLPALQGYLSIPFIRRYRAG